MSDNPTPADQIKSDASSKYIEGIDISHWQSNINFIKAQQQGKSFVFIKTTEGNSIQDPLYKQHVQDARSAKLIVGSYHLYVANHTPKSQFDNFSAQASIIDGDLPPAIDIESVQVKASSRLVQNLLKFIKLIEKKYQVKPIIYCNFDTEEQLAGLKDYPLWLASFTDTPPIKLKHWSGWTLWQYCNKGTIGDCTVDFDRCEDSQSLSELLIKK